MLGIYIAALIFGGGLLALSLFGGGESSEADGELDLDAGGDADLDAGADVEAGGDADHGADHGAGDVHGAADFVTLFISLRFWTFFLGFGGLTGSILTLIGNPAIATAAASVVMGLFCGTIAAMVVRALSRGQISSGMSADDWIGRTGKVVLPVSPARPGKIRVELDGEVQDVLAVTAAADGELPIGEAVLVVEMVDGVAKVTPNRPRDAIASVASRAAARREIH